MPAGAEVTDPLPVPFRATSKPKVTGLTTSMADTLDRLTEEEKSMSSVPSVMATSYDLTTAAIGPTSALMS